MPPRTNWLSHSFELAALGPLAFGAARGLLLHTPDLAKHIERVRARLAADGVVCRVGEFIDDATMGECIREQVAVFLTGTRLTGDRSPWLVINKRAAIPTG